MDVVMKPNESGPGLLLLQPFTNNNKTYDAVDNKTQALLNCHKRTITLKTQDTFKIRTHDTGTRTHDSGHRAHDSGRSTQYT